MASDASVRRPSAQQRLASERVAAAKARIAAAQRRRRLWIAGGAVGAVLAIVAALVVVKIATGAGGPESGQRATAAERQVITDVAGVPPATLNAVGSGSVSTFPSTISAPALTADGKARVLYVGAEYCPYCAAERWAVAVALSRFGTFSNLGQTTSSPSDVFPSTATLSFHGATYASRYLSFTGKEIQSNQVVDGSYAALDTVAPSDEALVRQYNSNGGIPFVDLGGKYVISGASYNPGVLQGKSHGQIAAALSEATSPIAQAIDGTANVITAAVCASTDNAPAAVCTASGVTAAAAHLNGS